MRALKLFTCIITISLIAVNDRATGQTVLLSEDFETASSTTPPGNWTRSQNPNSKGWEFGNASNLASNFFSIPSNTTFAASNDDAHDSQGGSSNEAHEDYLISPSINLSTSQNALLSFDAYFTGKFGSEALIEISTDGGMNWSFLDSVKSDQSGWQNVNIVLSNYAGNGNVKIRFHHDDNGNWASGFAVDNVEVSELANHDVLLSSQTFPAYKKIGYYPLQLEVVNFGAQELTSFVAEWSLNGGTVYRDTISNINVATGEKHTFTHDNDLNLVEAKPYQIDVEIKKPNFQTDNDLSNNKLTLSISTLSADIQKNVIINEYTGTWCKFCPDGAYRLQKILDTSDRAIGVSIHDGDPMEIPEGAQLISTFVSGFPSGDIDHFKFDDQPSVEINRTSWMDYFFQRLDDVVPVGVSASNNYNQSNNELYIDMQASFYGAATGDFRFNAYIVEDSVSGSGSGYNQKNAYDNEPGHPYENAGDPIIGYQHRHCLRDITGGAWGYDGIIDDTCQDGDQFSVSDTINVDQQWETDQIKIVAFVQEYDSDPQKRHIVNAVEMKLNSNANNKVDTVVLANKQIKNQPQSSAIANVYPNPAKDVVNIKLDPSGDSDDVKVEVFDISGHKVEQLYRGDWNASNATLQWQANDHAAGMYFIRVSGQNYQETQKVILSNH